MAEKGKEELDWEWEAKKDSWVRYDKASNGKLNSGDGPVVALKIEESDLEVDRANMRQKNRTTGFERSVRCCVEEEDGRSFCSCLYLLKMWIDLWTSGSRFAWEWQDEKRRWRSYPPEVVRQLENANSKKESEVNVVIAERSYTIDLDNMLQKNDTSSAERKVAIMSTHFIVNCALL